MLSGAGAGTHKNRKVDTVPPGILVRSEGKGATGDVAVDKAYDGLGATSELYRDVYQSDSTDDARTDLLATIHYGNKYNNAFWNRTQTVFGDGDGTLFNRFTIALDLMGHELTHGVTTDATAKLVHGYQLGALNESISDVFGSPSTDLCFHC